MNQKSGKDNSVRLTDIEDLRIIANCIDSAIVDKLHFVAEVDAHLKMIQQVGFNSPTKYHCQSKLLCYRYNTKVTAALLMGVEAHTSE